MNPRTAWLAHLDPATLTPGQSAALAAHHASRARRYKRAAWGLVVSLAAAGLLHVGWVAVR